MKASRQEQCLTIKLNKKMKKNIFISAALACVAFSSCQQENLGGNGAELDGFRVHTEDMTKAVLDGVKVVFEDEDAIDIYADNAETPAVYSYNKANDLFVATGTEAEGEEYTAIFPSTATNPSPSSIYISNRQVATENSFPKSSMYMAGVSNSKEIALKHLTGLWEIDLLPQYDGQKLVRASLAMNGGQKINGNFEINWEDYSLTYVDGGNNSILLADISYVMTAGETVKLYFALPEGKYDGGFTFTATMTDGTTMDVTSPSTINIKRGQITKVKNDVTYRLFASGAGTEDDPYIIKSVNHWNNLVSVVNKNAAEYGDKHYMLAQDIDFGNESITPIKNFTGTINGGNYTLSNAKIGDGTTSHQAFFYLLNGTVKNLKFDNITVTGGQASSAASSAAVITAGNSSVAFTIENCHVSNSTVISGPHDENNGGSFAGGLVGRCNNANAIIKNCSVSTSTITATYADAGGIAGFFGAGTIDCVKVSGNTISTENNRYSGGIVGEMKDGALINAISQNNSCSVGTVSCGGVVGACVGTTAEVINVLSEGNVLKSTSHQAAYYIGGLIGGVGKEGKVATVANCIVLSGGADYNYDSTKDELKPHAGCIGIALGYCYNKEGVVEYDVSNSIIHQAYRTRYDLVWTDNEETKDYRRDAIGQKQNLYNTGKESTGGIQGNFTRYLDANLTDGTALSMLNSWVESNKTTYPTLKSWTARTSDKAFPELVLEETATPSVNSLNIVESVY